MSVKLAVTGALSALAVGAVSVVGVTLAQDEPTSTAAVSAPANQGQDVGDSSPHGMSGPFAGHLGEMMANLPDDLRQDLTDAWEAGDVGDRLRALSEIHDQAAAGDYGAEVQEQVESLDDELPTQAELQQMVSQHLGALPVEVPAELRQALVRAAGNGDAGERLAAVADVHDRALEGEYGAQARTLVEQLGRFLEQMGGPGGQGFGGLGA